MKCIPEINKFQDQYNIKTTPIQNLRQGPDKTDIGNFFIPPYFNIFFIFVPII